MSFDVSKLQPGDPVAFTDSKMSYRRRIGFSIVERLTATQVVLANSKRFRRNDNAIVGEGWGELIDPDGPDAVAAWNRVVAEDAMYALTRLEREQGSEKPATPAEYLDKVAAVVEESRSRLREIGGGA
jgi:hypothetical protein